MTNLLLVKTEFLLLTLIIIPVLAVSAISGEDFFMPEFHVDIALQLEVYKGGDSTYVFALDRAGVNTFTIRHATMGAEGKLGDYIEYNMEAGVASCQRGGFMLMEAGVFYKPLPYLKTGLIKGHILRGFEMYEECVNLLTAEKAVFAKKYSPCHPTGFVIETDYDINKTMGLHAQLGYMSGTGGTFEDEHDINLGFQFRTPIQGLSIGGFYTDWQWHVDEYVFDPESMKMMLNRDIYNGYRSGFSYNFDEFDVHLRGEYYIGKGFKDRVDTTMSFEDMEMNAFFIEGGYSFDIGHEQISYIQPYVQYQWWDQAANLDGDYILSLAF